MVQISVRLSEGGAAGVARNLSNELVRSGIASPFVYGYGPHGGISPESSEVDSLRLTSRSIAGINRLSYSLRGQDTGLIGSASLVDLKQKLAAADIVHLHIIHSYFVGTKRLVDELIDAGKPVVWTLHDQWAMTGRCAQPGDCDRWMGGCTTCPNLNAYPSAKIDRASANWTRRRASIERLGSAVPLAIVACADWLASEARTAGLPNVHRIHNSVDRAFWKSATSARQVSSSPAGEPRNLFICRDLRDPAKVDWAALEAVARFAGQSLTIVGDNAKGPIRGASFRPSTGDRGALAQIYKSHDRLIFTSKVDYYPLTIAEAITSGTEVFAIRSRAAEEFSENRLLRIFENTTDLVNAVTTSPVHKHAEKVLEDARAIFDPSRMAAEYLELYLRLLGDR